MQQSKVVSFLVFIIYYLAVVLPHNFIGRLIGRNIGRPLGRANYNFLILSIGLIVAVIALFFARKRYVSLNKENRQYLFFYLFITSFLIILSFNILLVVNIEIIHFIQYCALAILLFPLLKSYRAVFWYGTILGFIDEIYQFIVLAPTADYFDFNDVFIDQIGLGIGLLFLFLYKKKEADSLPLLARDWILIVFTGVLSLIIVLLFTSGIFSVHPDGQAVIELIRKDKEGFWRTVPPQVTFHVMRPLEGIILICVLFLLYSPFKYTFPFEMNCNNNTE